MKFKRKAIALIASVLALMSMPGMGASAAQWYVGNQYWGQKTTTSGVHVSNSSMIYYASISVYGENNYGGTNKYPVGYNTTDLILMPNVDRLIRQYVFEWGYNYAHIVVNNPSGNTNSACGNWYPDTTSTYPYLN